MAVLVGLNLYDTDPRAVSRQSRAVEALARLDGVEVVNLQFVQAAPTSFGGIPARPVLRQDSNLVTGAPGRRKPLSREVFDVLASEASRCGLEYFAYVNSDVVVTASAIDIVRCNTRQTYVFSRTDVDTLSDSAWRIGGDPGACTASAAAVMTAGQDLFVVSVAWWRRNRWRFRAYILGEGCWDNVYTAQMMCHSNGLLLNRDPHILHERHAVAWHDATPAARYNGMLAALDARYFSLWCQYWIRLGEVRSRGASADEEQALRETLLTWRRSGPAAALQLGRRVRARLRYWQFQRAWLRATPAGA